MFRYNPAANYQPNGGRYLQILSGKDLYKQTIVVSKDDTFPVRFSNIFVDYPLGSMKVGDKLWTNWNKAPLKLLQTQLNFAVCSTSSACGVSSVHLNSVSENPRFSRCKICNANLHINGLKIAYLNERPLSKLWEL